MIIRRKLIDIFQDCQANQAAPHQPPSGIPSSSSSFKRKVRRLSYIYQRSKNQAHEADLIDETINFPLLAKANFEQSCFEDVCTNEVWM